MAARINKTELSDRWREKIRTSMLINRLQNHVVGRIEMTATQLRAAEILLKKNLPDLQAVAHSGTVDSNVTVQPAELVFGRLVEQVESSEVH